jgi:hypothetical protein
MPSRKFCCIIDPTIRTTPMQSRSSNCMVGRSLVSSRPGSLRR